MKFSLRGDTTMQTEYKSYRHVHLRRLFLKLLNDLRLLCRGHLLPPKHVSHQTYQNGNTRINTTVMWFHRLHNLCSISHYNLTLLIADIALVAPFIPTATEEWACIACKRVQVFLSETHPGKARGSTRERERERERERVLEFSGNLCMSSYASHLSSTAL